MGDERRHITTEETFDIGQELTLTVGEAAHGGHCVARHDGRVVFVRHGLPGETVRARITEVARTFARADVIDVVDASIERVEAPCRWASDCGGCDWQHARPEYQLDLLTAVVRDTLARIGSITWSGQVEAVAPALGWRTRQAYAVDGRGRLGLRRHRSHEIVAVDECLIADETLRPVTRRTWDGSRVEAVVTSTGQKVLRTDASRVDDDLAVDRVVGLRASRHDDWIQETVLGRSFDLSPHGFWQVHPAATRTLVDAVLRAAEARPGDRVIDLYAGAGLFSAFLAEQVGSRGRVLSIEGDGAGHAAARRNLAEFPHVRTRRGAVEHLVKGPQIVRDLGGPPDLVVLDPPRAGAKEAVRALSQWGHRRVVYVACDPAALARDARTLIDAGHHLVGLRAFALFPMTHHVECVAVFDRDRDAGGR